MAPLHRWKPGTAALMTMAITAGAITPLFTFSPVNAQFNNNGQYNLRQSRTVTIPANRNVSFPLTYEKDKIVVTPGETVPITLKIASDIIDSNRNVLIPAGTEVVGRLEPVSLSGSFRTDTNNQRQGVRFAAQELVFASGRRQQINATSRTYSQTERISKGTNTSSILTDAAIGAGAATAISLLTGNKKIEILEPIGGAAAGALASVLLRKNEADVFVVRPERDLAISLNSSLVLNPF
ncbi:hypothetical protein [Fortiea contorta]|uniref:hypothetical protein n=1 Tax=Fortiea contorta TaxID=1892405 RepID=UPI0003458E89|nr:hypothetical protein [Fortiea contorta]